MNLAIWQSGSRLSDSLSSTQTLSWDNPWPRLWYPGVAHMRVKHIQALSCDKPSASLMVPWCWDNPWASLMEAMWRSNAYKTQYKHWVEAIPRPHLWCPGVAQMSVKHNTSIEPRQKISASLMVPWCRSNVCKTQYKHWVETVSTLVPLICV